MASYNPPVKNLEYIFYIALFAQSDNQVKTTPTIASGDFKVSTDGGATSNLDTLPSESPAASGNVKVTVSATEMNGDNISIIWIDAAGDEWHSGHANLQPAAQTFDTMDTNIDTINTNVSALNDISAADVNTQVADVMSTDTLAEASAAPAANASAFDKIAWLATLARNRITQTATTQTIYADDATTPVATSTVADDGTTFSRGEFS